MRKSAIESPSVHAGAVLDQQLKLLARQVRRSPYAVFIVASSIVFGVYEFVSPWLSLGWLGLVVLCLVARRQYAGYVLRNEGKLSPHTAINRLAAFACLNGAAIGLSAPLFFGQLPDTSRAIVSMVLVGLAAAGIATSAAYRPAFTAYVIPALMPLAASWIVVGGMQRVLIGVLIVIYSIVLFSFVRENHQLLSESVTIRFEREQLLQVLELQNIEVRAAVKKAEEAGRAKARVLAAASHDLRQPLYALSLYSAVLARNPTQETLATVSGHIDLSVRSLGALLNALLDLSRLDAGVYQISRETFDVNHTMRRVADEYREKAERKGLSLLFDEQSQFVHSDPIVVERILRNLVDNAIKYTDSGFVELKLVRDGARIVIEIADSGKGIPDTEKEHVFEEFYQLDNPGRDREQGLGLGLSIVKRLAELIGSSVTLESELGIGSRFSIPFPVASAPTTESARIMEQAEQALVAGAHILLIDDESAVRHGMTLLLQSWGLHLHCAADLPEARHIMELRAGAIDLIIADLRLQDGADGLSAVRALYDCWGPIPVLLASGETDPTKLKDADDSGFPLLHKPVSQEVLRKSIATQLAST